MESRRVVNVPYRAHLRDGARPTFGSPRSQQGFTLIELLVVVTILPLIVGALALGIVTVFSQQSTITGRLSGSTDLQTMNATFIRDVESAQSLTNQSTPQACGASGTQLLGLSWSSGQTNVSYVEVPVSSNANAATGFTEQIQRLYCIDGSPTPVSVMVVSADASQTLQQAPTICLGNVSTGSCTAPSTYPVSASDVAQVTFSVYVPVSTSTSPFVMVASPRQGSGGVISNGPNLSTPLLLTSTQCGTVLTVNNGGQLWINVGGKKGNGVLTVASPCAGTNAIAHSGDSGRGSICVSAVISGSLPLGSFSNPPGVCPATTPITPKWYYRTVFVNPFANLQAPPTTGLSPGTCIVNKYFSSGYTCSAGSYTMLSAAKPSFTGGQTTYTYANGALPSFPNNSSVQFTSGAYSFGVPVIFPNGTTATFELGTYAFLATGNALDVTANNGASITGNSVLFYAPNGSMSFGNKADVRLTPNPDPQYLGVTVWDGPVVGSGCPSSPTFSVTLANNGTDSYGGVYAPCATLITHNNGSLLASIIVAASAQFTKNTIINVTPS